MAGEHTWTNQPYYQLGKRLKEAREKLKQTLAEVSGSVEIDLDTLSHIENGQQRPNEDTLMLLINHLNLSDQQASDLWEMAGYSHINADMEGLKPLAAILPLDNRVIYTDMMNVMVNNYGVVLSFMQNTGGGQPQTVAKVGMSKEHARSVLEVLKTTLEKSETASQPKSLPASTKKHKHRKNR
jgi:transcriptional regulator with XRE-family HTH domain